MAANDAQNQLIVITGFMASGKTTVAKALATLLHCPAIDLDGIVTEWERRTPGQVIEEDGEKYFRALESRALVEALSLSAGVVALGGGAWTLPENRASIWERAAITVWLDAPFELCWRRILATGASRPLAPDRESAEGLFQERRSHYQLAQVHIELREDQSPVNVALRIVKALDNYK